jgi:hypothetical protein
MLYVWLTFVSALSVNWIIGSGLWLIFGIWTETLNLYIFLNDFFFPLVFGLPVFIAMTSPMVNVRYTEPKPCLFKLSGKRKIGCVRLYALMLGIIFIMTQSGAPVMKPALIALSVPCAVLSLVLLL